MKISVNDPENRQLSANGHEARLQVHSGRTSRNE